MPSVTLGLRWTSDDGRDDLKLSPTPSTADSGATTICNGSASPITTNSTITGTSRLKPTIFMKIRCRTSKTDGGRYMAGGGTPFSPQFIPFNAPGAAQCNEYDGADLHRFIPRPSSPTSTIRRTS